MENKDALKEVKEDLETKPVAAQRKFVSLLSVFFWIAL
jgi:hypothetical protein